MDAEMEEGCHDSPAEGAKPILDSDTTLLQNNLTRFTLSFWNPDLRTPYKFHGAQFSFSLNFISSLP